MPPPSRMRSDSGGRHGITFVSITGEVERLPRKAGSLAPPSATPSAPQASHESALKRETQSDGEGEANKRMRPQKKRQDALHQDVEALKGFRDHLRDHGLRPPAETIKDPRGNLMSINSTGHIHHPSNLGGSARAAGAGCQPAAGAGCQPVDPAPVAAGPRPDPKAAPASLRHRRRRDGGDPAAAPFWAAVAAESVDLLNLSEAPGAGPATSPWADMKLLPGLEGSDRQAALEHNAQTDGAAGAGTDAGRPGHDAILDGLQALRFNTPTQDDMAALTNAMETGFDEILDGMQELRDGMDGCRTALAVRGAAMATKDDIAALTTAMEKMFKRLDDMEEKVQSLQHGWKVVPEEAAEGAAEGAVEDHE